MALLSIITQAGFSGRRCLCKPHVLCPSESNNEWKCITPESPQHYHLQPLLGYWHWRDKLSNSMSVWQISFENCMSLFNNTVYVRYFWARGKEKYCGHFSKGGDYKCDLPCEINWMTDLSHDTVDCISGNNFSKWWQSQPGTVTCWNPFFPIYSSEIG